MASVVDICNKALSLLGQKTITSLDDDSPEGLACRIHWPLLRDEVLRSHTWNCVKSRAALNQLSTAPAFGYSYQYQLPSDCLYPVKLEDDSFFEIEGRKILTDASGANLHYIVSESDSTIYDAQLSAALSYLLAGELAPQMTSSNSESQRLLGIGKDKLSDAKATDSFEGRTRNKQGTKWLNAKYGG